MKYKAFERAAREAFDSIPEEYTEGVDGLVVSRESIAHPTLPDIFTLGECVTEDYASDWAGPDTTRSVVVLYWGSFRSLAARDPEFDWEEELWETLTHELRHHLESLAGADDLEDVDYAMDQLFNRNEGQPFDPWYYQRGDDLKGGVFRVERAWYLEQLWRAEDFEREEEIAFDWRGTRWRIPRPGALGDVHYVWIDGVESGDDTLELVLVRKRSWWEDARRLLGTYRPHVLESEAKAEPSGAPG